MKYILAVILFVTSSVFSADALPADKIYKIFSNDGKHEWCASGFFISEHSIITAAHTFAKGGMNHFILDGKRFVHVFIAKIDYDADIAILSCEEKHTAHFEIADANPEKRDEAEAVGFPGHERTIASVRETIRSVGSMIKCRPDVANGMSGCPLLKDGKVVGMIVQGDEKESKSIPVWTLIKFVNKK